MIERYNSFEHFISTCKNKADFKFGGVDLLPDHPGHFWGIEDYTIDELCIMFDQDGGNNGPYTVYFPIQVWRLGHHDEIITFDELVDYKDQIQCITMFDEDLEDIDIKSKEPTYDSNDYEVAIYKAAW